MAGACLPPSAPPSLPPAAHPPCIPRPRLSFTLAACGAAVGSGASRPGRSLPPRGCAEKRQLPSGSFARRSCLPVPSPACSEQVGRRWRRSPAVSGGAGRGRRRLRSRPGARCALRSPAERRRPPRALRARGGSGAARVSGSAPRRWCRGLGFLALCSRRDACVCIYVYVCIWFIGYFIYTCFLLNVLLARPREEKASAVAAWCRRRVGWSRWMPTRSRRPALPSSVGACAPLCACTVTTPDPLPPLPPSLCRCLCFI